MKTIAEFVASGIKTADELKAALKIAMRLEFATLPPYLCAQWSIDADPDHVSRLIRGIVLQEMYHFALAGNMLTAIGGMPDVANAAFVPSYPTDRLPGDIFQALPVDLRPLSPDQLKVFMQIENPEFPPLGRELKAGPATIGDFYNTILAGFDTVKPVIDPSANAVDLGEAHPIKTIQDAQDAIALIKEEGEGTPQSPDQPGTGMQLAHYYKFKEVLKGKTFVEVSPGNWDFAGTPIRFPTVLPFSKSTKTPSPSLAFNQALAQLLIGLQACWTTGASPDTEAMNALEDAGRDLIKQGILPEFLWADP